MTLPNFRVPTVRLLAALAVGLATLSAPPARAQQGYPSRPVQLVVAFEPVWAIAFFVAVASLIFGFFGREKGPKLAVIAFLIAFAIVWFGWGAEIMDRLTSGDFSAGMDAPSGQQAESPAADAALGAVSDAEGA